MRARPAWLCARSSQPEAIQATSRNEDFSTAACARTKPPQARSSKLVRHRRHPVNKIFPIAPSRPEKICWGCDKYCSVKDMACGNGSDRTPHPSELFGPDWMDWGSASQNDSGPERDGEPPASSSP
jgi:hypothetical protein